jgi:uncharacterized delta-60 repeat protein
MSTNTAPSFMVNVPITTDMGYTDIARLVAVQADGKIVVEGMYNYHDGTATKTGIKLVRYDSDGSLDTSFGNQGLATASISPIYGTNYGLTGTLVQTDGKILLAQPYGVARYNSDGSADTSFSGDGQLNATPPKQQFSL